MTKFHTKIPASDQKMLAGMFSGVDVNLEVDTDKKVLLVNRGESPVIVKLDLEEGEIPDLEESDEELTPEDEEFEDAELEDEIDDDEEDEEDELDG
jgi:hypothetical protein